MSHDPRGIEIQFTLYMIAYLLLLSFKQRCNLLQEESIKESKEEYIYNEDSAKNSDSVLHEQRSFNNNVCGLVSLLGKRLQKYWKIGIHWLTTVRNLLFEPFTPEIVKFVCRKQ